MGNDLLLRIFFPGISVYLRGNYLNRVMRLPSYFWRYLGQGTDEAGRSAAKREFDHYYHPDLELKEHTSDGQTEE